MASNELWCKRCCGKQRHDINFPPGKSYIVAQCRECQYVRTLPKVRYWERTNQPLSLGGNRCNAYAAE